MNDYSQAYPEATKDAIEIATKAFDTLNGGNKASRKWLIRVIQQENEKEASVEFYDVDCGVQFVSRYYLSTLLNHQRTMGLDLMCYESAWKIASADLNQILDWLVSLS